MMLALLVMGVSNVFAQDVTISPSSGSLMAAYTQEGEAGSAEGWSSTWRHKQLPLSMNVADFCNITDGGELANPAGNMGIHDGYIILTGGARPDGYITISLPKGFRFTRYEIVLANDIGDAPSYSSSIGNQKKVFYETDDLSYKSATTEMVYHLANDYAKYSEIVSAIRNGDSHYLAVARKGTGANSTFEMSNQTESGESNYYIISRSGTEADMGNHLYFRVSHESDQSYFGIRIVSAKIYFTAEGNFNENVAPEAKPTAITTSGFTYMKAPFTTGKLDLGQIDQDEYDHYTYNWMNVRDLYANNVIMQDNAVDNNGSLPQNATSGNIFATSNNGNLYYGLKNDTYFVECPVDAKDGNNLTSPIGFRIVGAKIKYTYGKKEDEHTETYREPYEVTETEGPYENKIIYFSGDWDDYYLTNTGYASTRGGQIVIFDGTYIRLADSNGDYYLTDTRTYGGGTRYAEFTTDKSKAKAVNYGTVRIGRRDYTGIYYIESGNYYFLRYVGDGGFRFQNNYGNLAKLGNTSSGGETTFTHTTTNYNETDVTIPAFEPKPYTLTVFGKDGSTDVSKGYQTKTINSSTKDGYLELTGLNNDAIKFQISGLPQDANGSNYQALITVELTMQALDPFIKSMDIVCNPTATTGSNVGKLSQTFTATDFSVRGGAFEFYVPEDYPLPVKFTFENLKSDYADETYPGGTSNHFSRYNFVMSDYFDKTPSLYSGYSVSSSDAASAITSGDNCKTVVLLGGDREFKFNNAAEVSAGTEEYFREYPFSTTAYTNAGGSFGEVTCSTVNTKKTAYLFTCDETRYNISPQKSTEHRYYAYYQMDMTLRQHNFPANITPTLIYENTFYEQATTDAKRLAQYGVKLDTGNDKIWVDDPTLTEPGHKKQVPGYLTVTQIKNAIAGLKASHKIEKEQILYVDASDLFYVCAWGENTLDKIKEDLGPNVLVYLPEGMSTEYPNFAVKSGTSFLAAKNIVLTDKYPFFAPYNIQVGEANYAYYKRLITKDQNGKVWNGTVILPFTIDVNEGIHENYYTKEQVTEEAIAADGDPRCRFTLAEMNADKPLAHEKNSISDDYGVGYFSPISGTKSVANKPYVVQVDTKYDGYDDDNSSFIVRAYNALIEATPTDATGKGVADYTNETVSGVQFNNATFTFTNTGTYTGIEFDKVVGDVHKGAAEADVQVFYFAHDYFLDSRTLKRPLSLKMLPFRSYYVYTSSSNSKLSRFSIVFGENDEMGGTNGITDVQRDADLAIIPGKGTITIMARADKDVTVHAVNGQTVDKCNLNAGETRTVSVPAGVYVINGVKMVVK